MGRISGELGRAVSTHRISSRLVAKIEAIPISSGLTGKVTAYMAHECVDLEA
jgi:hypothetical protein